MNWQKKIEASFLLNKYEASFPSSFYNAFFILFDEMEKEKEILEFLERFNKRMEEKKGENYTITYREIIYYREVNTYINLSKYYSRNRHHVTPSSRIQDEEKKLKERVIVPILFHQAWHLCFGNLYGDEVICFMKKFFKRVENKKSLLLFKSFIELQDRIKRKN